MSILWVDNNADDFPIIRRLAEQNAVSIETVYTIVEAFVALQQGLPQLLLLDAIVPLGNVQDEGLAEGAREFLLKSGEPTDRSDECTGLLVLDRFGEVAGRTLMLSVVSEKQLRSVFGTKSVGGFMHKGDIGLRKEFLRQKFHQLAADGMNL